ncbi:hypothetical protein [Leptospira vanthielii]|uniref:Uncharacterized protein n=1 Tax=Leptospira vanthielii serovar Holland str. Waz Holland = ATCC 700522 TaxID=1218591 RepID=N1WB33_9LEPT|nr:hypothetical protein [Leptospira vanthielii]EMY70635.1 hypothetical protein LEP1GSC199_2875 [Leptospira vanthielii serovar Holland str. Waz Holland = ATCC 700522]
MHKIYLLVFLSFINCLVILKGQETIRKSEAEREISKIILLKTISCGYNAGRAYAISELGNEEEEPYPWVQIGGGSNASRNFYDVKALNHCLRSLSAMPCPTKDIKTHEGDQEYIATLIFTRYQSCTFRPIENWKIFEPFKGEI